MSAPPTPPAAPITVSAPRFPVEKLLAPTYRPPPNNPNLRAFAIATNGCLNRPPLAILRAVVPRNPKPVNIPLNPSVNARIVPPAINNCLCNIPLNLLSASILPSAFAFNTFMKEFANHPPVRYKKNVVNLPKPNCTFCATLRTGSVSACCTRLST